MLTLVLVHEKLAEFNFDCWIAAVDFEKAFDSVSHESIWEAMRAQNAPEDYVQVLRRIYGGQTGQVIADQSSRIFTMERGTRQGAPLSPMLFNAVLEHIMRKLKVRWQKKRYGIQVNMRYLQNLRFADDVLLFGSTRAQIRNMLEDLSIEAGRVGLKLHMGKTKILSNMNPRRGVLTQNSVRPGS